MPKFLLDANLSPETSVFLKQQFSFDVASLITLGQAGLTDDQVVNLAARENRVIITLDLDFGSLYHEARDKPKFGVIILRLRDQRVETVNQILLNFFSSTHGHSLFHEHPHALVVLNETSIRVTK